MKIRPLIIPIIVVILIAAFAIKPVLFNELMALLFLGIVPATNIQIPAWLMIVIYSAIGTLLILWLSTQPLYIGGLAKQEQTARQIARKKVAKKVGKPYVSRRRNTTQKTTIHSA